MSNMKLEHYIYIYMGVSKNKGTPKSSILIRFSTINHPFWGTPIFGNTHIYIYIGFVLDVLTHIWQLVLSQISTTGNMVAEKTL